MPSDMLDQLNTRTKRARGLLKAVAAMEGLEAKVVARNGGHSVKLRGALLAGGLELGLAQQVAGKISEAVASAAAELGEEAQTQLRGLAEMGGAEG